LKISVCPVYIVILFGMAMYAMYKSLQIKVYNNNNNHNNNKNIVNNKYTNK